MKTVSRDQKIIELLISLKNAEHNYPSDLMRSRRDMFAQLVASIAQTENSDVEGTDTGNQTPPSMKAL